MRRPPFTVRPLALSVTLVLTAPMAMAADILASAVVGTNPTTTYNSDVVLTNADKHMNVVDATLNANVDAIVAGVVKEQNSTDSTQLIKQGSGTLSLTNNNSYKGGTEIQDGTLSIARAASLGSGDVVIDASTNQNVTLETQSSTTLTQNINLLGDDATIKTGGTNAGGNITQITGTVSGTGQLIKDGAGTLSLTNNNSYKGGTEIQDGTLSIARASSLGDGKEVILGTGATLDTQASTTLTQDITLTGDATISTTGAENITQVTSTIKDNKDTSGVSAGLTKAGEGTLSLTADNAYHGNTTINQGTLAISRNDSLGTGTLVTINGATLKTNQDVNVGQDVTIIGQGKIDTGGKNSILSGMVTGGTLEKTGNGSLTLNDEANSQSNTILNGGILIIDDKDKNNVSTLGTGNLEIKKGTLQTSSDMVLNNNITTTSSAGGSINTNGHDVTLNGQVTVKQIGVEVDADGNPVLKDGSTIPVYGDGRLVKTGGGTLTLNNTANDYNVGIVTDSSGVKSAIVGNTVINGGVLAISNNDQLGIAAQTGKLSDDKDLYKWQLGNVLVDGGTLQTTQSLTSNRHIYVGAAGATVNVDGAANTTVLTGAIKNDGAVGGSLVKEGAGTLKVNLNFNNYLKSDGSFGITANDSIGTVTVKEGVLEVFNTAKDFGTTQAAVTLAGGELRINQGASTGNDLRVVTLQGTGGTLDTTGATIRTGKITGNGSLQKQGSGTLVLTGLANDYKGDTTISGGKVQINSAQGLGDANTGKLILDGGSLQVLEDKTAPNQIIVLGKETVISSNNGTIDNVSNDVTLSGAVSGKGQLIKSGAGKFVLSYEKNTFEGGVRIKEGTLEVSSDGALGKENTQVLIDGATLGITKNTTLNRQIVLTGKGGTVSVEGSSTATLNGQLALDTDVLSADLTKAGTGTLNLTKDNDGFKGNTIIKEGTLGITGQNNLANGKLFLDGGNLRTNASLNFDKEIIINSTGGIDTSLDALGNKTEVTVTSKIQGNGGFVKTGEGTLTLSADNAYAGGTTVQGGTLVVDKDTNLGLASTDVTLDGGTLKLNAASSVDFTTKDNDQDTDDADARKLLIGSGGGTLDITALDVTIETALTGKGTLTQKGNQESTLTLTANNTALEGGITVENGTLKIKDNTNLGALAATLTLKDGTTLDTTNADTSLVNADTSLVLDRSLTLGDGKVSLKQDENLTIERGLIGSDKSNLVIDTNDKKLVLNGNNSTFAGNLLVEGNIEVKQNLGTGTVEFNQGQDSANAENSSVHMTGNATFNNKEFKLNGQTTLVADKDTKSIFNAAINDAEYIEKDAANNDVTKYRKGSLVKTGEGEIVLNTKNAYSGDTSIQQGTVTVAHNEALGTGKVSLANGTTLQSAANVTLANKVEVVSGNVTLSTPQVNQQDTSLTLTNTVSGAASMTKTGIGTLVLNGVNTYTGQTIVKEGTLEINRAAALGTNTELSLSAGTTLITTGQMTQKDDTTDKTLSKNILLVGQAGSQVTINTVGGDVILSGKLQNDAVNNQAGIIKEGVSTLTLSGDNSSYQGKTTIKDGNIAISDKKNLGGKVDVELVGVKLPSGELVGGGLTLLENLTILAQNEDGSTNSINIIGTGKGEINTASGTTSELGVAFKGTGKFVKQGDGELILSGDNTDFAGGVSVDKGILTITKDVSLGKTNTDVILNGGTLQANGVTTLDRNVQLTKDSTIKNISATETVTLNRLTNAHQITLEGGSFNLANDGTHTNQHDGTVLKNTTVTISTNTDLDQSAGALSLAGYVTLNATDDVDASERQIKIVGAGNIIGTDDNKVTLGTLEGDEESHLQKRGDGTLVLEQDNKNYKGYLDIEAGKVVVSHDQALGTQQVTFQDKTTLAISKGVSLANDLALNGKMTFDNQTFTSQLLGQITDADNAVGSLIKDGIGQLTLSQDNSYSGGTQIQAGTVVINTNKALGTGAVNLQSGSTLQTDKVLDVANAMSLTTGSGEKVVINTVNRTAELTLSNTLSGDAHLSKEGEGALVLKGDNKDYQGNISVNKGLVAVDTNSALGSTGKATFADDTELSLGVTKDVIVGNNIQLDGAVKVHNVDFAGSLTGKITDDAVNNKIGSLVKDGGKQLTLSQDNSYSGGTQVLEGKVAVNADKALGTGTATFAGGTELILGVDKAVSLENKIELVSGVVSVNVKDAIFNSHLISEVSGAGSLIKDGIGQLTLSQDNSYSGGTQVQQGKVAVDANAALGTGAATFADGTELSLGVTKGVNVANNIQLDGQVKVHSSTFNSTLTSVSGEGGFIKDGEGQLTLSQDNSYKGGTTIQAGKVAIQTNQAFGSGDVTFGSGDVTFGQNTQLVINANVSLANNFNLAGATTLADQGFNTTLKGNINGAGALTKSDTGLLTVESSNSTYNSAVNINKGSVAINKSDALGTGTLTLAQDTGITTIVGQDITLNNNSIVLQGDGDPDTTTDKVSFNIANNQVLTLSNELKGDASLVKDGNGTLTLSGIKTNTGNLVVNAGTVSIANASAVGSGAMIFAENTRLQSAVNTILANQIVFNGNTTFDTASNSSLSVQANAITGAGGLTKTGAGKLALNVNNLYLGNTVIERGSVLVAANQAFSTGKVSFKSGTSLELQSNIANALDLTGNVTVSATTNFGLTGAITGTGNFIKQGEGTVALASDNSAYQGSATIEAGRLALQTAFGTDNTITLKANTGLDIIANNFVLTNNLKLDGNATLSVFNNNVTLLGKLSGTSTLTKDGVGVLTLAADNSSYNSGLLVNAGLIAVSNDANLGSLSNSIRLDNGGIRSLTNQNYFHNLSLAVAGGNIDTGANQVTWSGVVSGDGNLTKIGEGTLTLAGVNTYKGTTVINAGTLSVANVNSLGNTTNLAISNATFNPTANLAIGNVSISNTANILTDNTLSVNGVVSGSGALIKKGTGNLELLSANTYAGGTILEGGTLTLGTGNSLGTGALTLRSGQLSLKEGFTSTKTLTQNAADKTTEMLGSGAFANTVVDQGLLLVNGTLTSPITVGSKGTLGGSGKVIGDISVAGVLSPGNSPAVLSVQGNVTQDVGSTLKIDIDGLTAGTGAGHYDQLNVSGNYVIKSGTTLDAKLRGITGLANNNFVPVIGQSFDIVKANNVNGVFAQYQQLEGVKDGLAADTILRVGYTTNSVVLYVTPKSYSAIVSGENRQGAGVFLDNILKAVDKDTTLLAGNTDVAKFYRALVPASSQALNDALLMMSPAVYAESAQNILSLQQTLHNTQTIADTFTKGGVALKALAKEVDIDSDGNGVSATHSIAGVQLSVDSEPYKNGWQIGANLSVVNKANVEANNAKITTSGQDVTLSLRKKMGDWLLTGSIDVGSYDFDARRNIVIANDVFNTSQESMKSMTRGLGLTAGTQMGNFLLSGGVRYNSVVQDGFVEAGNSLLKLDVEKVEENQVIAMAGGTWAKTWKGSMWSIAPKVGLQLEQTVVGDTAQVKASLASQQVSATASEVGKTLVRAMIGVNFVNVDGINIGIDASTEQADNLSANTGRLTFSKSF